MKDFEGNNENKLNSEESKRVKKIPEKGFYLSIGIALGVVYGIIFDNLAIGMGVGLCIGVAIDESVAMKNKKK